LVIFTSLISLTFHLHKTKNIKISVLSRSLTDFQKILNTRKKGQDNHYQQVNPLNFSSQTRLLSINNQNLSIKSFITLLAEQFCSWWIQGKVA